MKAKYVFGNLLTTLSAKKNTLFELFLSNYLSPMKKYKLVNFLTNKNFKIITPSETYNNSATFLVKPMIFPYIFNNINIKKTVFYVFKIDLIINKMFTVFHPVAMFAPLRFKSNITTEFMQPNRLISPTQVGNKIGLTVRF